jgi:hypothetical protein
MKPGSHISCSRKCGRVWRNEPPHSQVNSHFGSWNPNGLPNFQRAIIKVKTHWNEEFLISLEKILELICPKWACMTHLDTYGQKKGRESNCQFDSRPLKVKNRPDFLTCRLRATYHWRDLDKGYNFVSDLTSIRDLHEKLWTSKSWGSPNFEIFGIPTWESRDKMTFGCWPHGQAQRTL